MRKLLSLTVASLVALAVGACEEPPTKLSGKDARASANQQGQPGQELTSTPSKPRFEAMSNSRAAVKAWRQGFETDASGWFDGEEPGGNSPIYGTLERVRSGTGGIRSSSGRAYLSVGPDDGDLIFECGTLPASIDFECTTAPFSFFAGASNQWPNGGWVAETDIYLDPSWPVGTGFDFSVASASAQLEDGDVVHDRDHIFHVSKDVSTGDLLVGASNNSSFSPQQDLENEAHVEITEAGWYTFRHVFRNDGGRLAVDVELVQNGQVLFSKTQPGGSDQDIPSEVGGNYYTWFVFVTDNFDSEVLAADAHQLRR